MYFYELTIYKYNDNEKGVVNSDGGKLSLGKNIENY